MQVSRIARLVVAGLAALCILAPCAAALADAPSREPVLFETMYLTGVCPFDVKVEAPFNKGKVTTFVDKTGNVRLQLYTGGTRLRLTNLSTNASIDLNTSAAERIVTNADGTTQAIITGPASGGAPAGIVTDLPPIWAFSGQVVLTIDASGAIVSLTHTPGPVTDVCAALAG